MPRPSPSCLRPRTRPFRPHADHLLIRRPLGYKLNRAERLRAQFVDYLDAMGAKTVTVDHALAWSLLPRGSV